LQSANRAGLTSRLLLIAAALLFSTGGAAIKATALTAWQVAGFRSAVAAAVLLIALPETRSGWDWRVLPAGAAYAATMVLFVLANKLTTAADTIFLQSTAPLYMLVLGPLLLHEPVRRADLLCMAGVATGMAFFFAGAQASTISAPDPLRGKLLAACAGICWAFTLAGFRWLGRNAGPRDSSMPAVVTGNLLAFAACLPEALPITRMSPADISVVLYLGIFQVGIAYICLACGLRAVPALTASILLLVEPALNPVWAWMLHGERPGARPLLGGALILLSTFLATLWQARAKRTAEPGAV